MTRLGLMRAFFAVTLLAATMSLHWASATTLTTQHAGTWQDGGSTAQVKYSPWRGDCSTSEAADHMCSMRLDALSETGELLGAIIFGQAERSRFLAVQLMHSSADGPLVVKIDDGPISVSIKCDGKSGFCLAVLPVDDKLLGRLMNGSKLSAEMESGMRLSFPLQDFTRSRQTLL